MGRSAAEIDAAKAVLATTDLTAVTSEVRQFPPGYVTGGRLKLNTNLQIEVAPIAINIAGKDVRTADTVIIGNEHWIIDGVETPRVPGSWYYLYLSTAAQFAVSPVEPAYNNLYFAHYHPEIQDLRAIGKFYYGSQPYGNVATYLDGIFYVQSTLIEKTNEIWIGLSENENIDYICAKPGDVNIFLLVSSMYLYSVYGAGIVHFTSGYFHFLYKDKTTYLNLRRTVSIEGSDSTYWVCDDFSIFENLSPVIEFETGNSATFQNIILDNITLLWHESYIKIKNNKITNAGQIRLLGAYNTIEGNICYDCKNTSPLRYVGGWNIISNNHIVNCGQINKPIFSVADVTITNGLLCEGTDSIITNNYFRNNGNLISESSCESSSTSPMIFGEAAPTASNCTWGFTSTGPYEGTGQYRFSKTVAAGTKAYLHLVDNVGAGDLHGFIPGTQYEWSGWFKCYSSASGGFQGPRFYQATTAGGASSATAVTIATASWQWVAVTATIYVNATTAYFGFWASASIGSTTYFDVDNVRLFPPGTTNVHNQNYYNGGTDTYDGL